ncbi:ABC transporter, ATP-binding protein, partial [Teladorsagia circumcincta]
DAKKKDPPNEEPPPSKKNVVHPIQDLYVDDPKKNAKETGMGSFCNSTSFSSEANVCAQSASYGCVMVGEPSEWPNGDNAPRVCRYDLQWHLRQHTNGHIYFCLSCSKHSDSLPTSHRGLAAQLPKRRQLRAEKDSEVDFEVLVGIVFFVRKEASEQKVQMSFERGLPPLRDGCGRTFQLSFDIKNGFIFETCGLGCHVADILFQVSSYNEGDICGGLLDNAPLQAKHDLVMNFFPFHPLPLNPARKGSIHFRDIHFSYPSRPDVLKGITFTVEAGEKVALVGSSGSGKSTLTALLLRFYDPDSGSQQSQQGRSEVAGNCCTHFCQPWRSLLWRHSRSFWDRKDQDACLYNRRSNWFQLNSIKAKKMVSELMKFCRGLQLSGGQKQRVAIARAVIRKPTVMLFDEATSALDNLHEEEVQHAIDLASEGLTTITIAHRLSTVKNCDRIIVMDEGRIVEEGPPDELLAKDGGRFRSLYNDQRMDLLAHAQPTYKTSLVPAASLALGEHYRPQINAGATRGAWNSSSLGGKKKKLGKSYSVLSHDERLPVMSKKRSRRLDYKYSNVGRMDIEIDVMPEYEEVENHLPGKSTNFNAVWKVIANYREGYSLLAGAIPTTILRAFFYLLICFEVASVLEIAITPQEQRNDQIFIVAAVYTALIIIKTIFEALGRLFIALYGHGFCSCMRSTMFRKIMRHGCAYFDEERNSPGLFSFAAAMYINWKMALLCSFQFPAYFIIRIVQMKEGTKRQRAMVEEENKAANLASVVLSNMGTIKAYNLQEHFYSVFADTLEPLARAMKRQSVISAFVFACQYSFTYILIAITLYFGKVMMLSNEITKLEGSIKLKNVSFRYPTRPVVPILEKLNLEINAGQSVALVGPSGSGKTSVIALIQRLYNATDGEVLMDKYNVKSINPAYLRRMIVSVGQEPTLFSFTIKENIAYGMMESEVTMEKIEEAAKIANIHDFIMSLPQGYDTEIGEFGAQLSGGQKQRIAIARAIVRRPVVLLMDEATAALDSTSEKYTPTHAHVLVAHRLSSIRGVDKICVLVDGAIAEEGTHDALIAKRGLYYNMTQSA